jgi:heme/copper-type cytochrome/quinol oxidase subunit 3
MLFVSLFFAYYFLGQGRAWPPDEPPRLLLASVMLAVLLASSVVAEWAWRARRRHRHGQARAGLAGAIALGCVFLALQAMEFREHLRTLRPDSDAYGSIFYTLTSFHGAHVIVGMLMLAFVAVLPTAQAPRSPYHAQRNATLYWHFVDGVWLFLYALLYAAPQLSS